METTQRQKILDLHEMVNDHYFKGLLNTPNFIFYYDCIMDDIGNISDILEHTPFNKFDNNGVFVHGYYWAEKNLIGLSVNDEIYTTLIHEMIHQFQQELNLIDKDHGTTFRKYARIFEHDLRLESGAI